MTFDSSLIQAQQELVAEYRAVFHDPLAAPLNRSYGPWRTQGDEGKFRASHDLPQTKRHLTRVAIQTRYVTNPTCYVEEPLP